jgi:predicted DNA-binding transcriptional regulator YafY
MSAVAVDPGLHQLLYSAIQNRRLIRFRYKNKERIVEPHDYGIQKGIARLLSWQVGGQSGGRLPGWRWFDVPSMQNIEVLERSFPGNREVSDKHHQWDQIFIRVAPPGTKN